MRVTIYAISYERYSSAAQADGDSERRQDEHPRRICKQEGWTLVESLRFRDYKRSAYRGDQQKELARLLEMAEAGELKTEDGDPIEWLIVEHLDRLTRKGMRRMLELLWSLTDARLNVHAGGMKFTKENQDELAPYISALVSGHQANSAPKTTGSRLKEGNAHKLELVRAGKIVPLKSAPWLYWPKGEDGRPSRKEGTRYRINKRIAAPFVEAFRLRGLGNSSTDISEALNQGGYWYPPKRGEWYREYIDLHLRNRAAYGVGGMAGVVREGYYPAIITKAVFDRAQVEPAKNVGRPGRGGGRKPRRNVFAGVSRCGICDWTMRYLDTRTTRYLWCSHAYRNRGCDGSRVQYELLESVLLHVCSVWRSFDPAALDQQVETERQRVQGQLAVADLDLVRIDKQITNLKLSIAEAEHDEHRKELNDTLRGTLARRMQARQDRDDLDAEQHRLQANTAEAIGSRMRGVEELLERLDGTDSQDLVVRTNSMLMSLAMRN